MTELIDMFMPTPFLITLAVSLYVIHRSFHKVDILGFVVSATIGLTCNFYMTKYLHINPIAALIITIGIFPLLEILWAMSMSKMHKEAEVHHWHMPHPHMPHFNQQISQTPNARSVTSPKRHPRSHGVAKHPPHP